MRTSTSTREVSGLRLALLELHAPDRRPLTWDTTALQTFRDAVAAVDASAVDALVLVSAGGLGAGADLREMRSPLDPGLGRRVAERGYEALEPLRRTAVPTVALVEGTTLGGAMEVALAADARIASASADGLGLPEVRLGLVPGWGGLAQLSAVLGRSAAGRTAVVDALAGRTATAQRALETGVVDLVLTGEDRAAFLDSALAHVAAALLGHRTPEGEWLRAVDTLDALERWDADALATSVERRTPGGTSAVRAAVALLDQLGQVEGTGRGTLAERAEARRSRSSAPLRAETVEAFGALVGSHESRSAIAGFFAVQRARSETRRAARDTRWTRFGVVGGGLMATQLAAHVASRTGARVHLVEVDDERAGAAVDRVRTHLDRAVRAGLDAGTACAAAESTTASSDLGDLAGCEAVLEAVVEDLDVKRGVWKQLEDVVDSSALLLTNTSSLSVAAVAEVLHQPGRAVGLHFFNPVAVLPLAEVVSTPSSDPDAVQRTLALASRLGKTAVLSADAPGFIVNRLLSRWLGDALSLVDSGEDPQLVDSALSADGLPMTPFHLVEHIGPAVQLHILETLHGAFPERFAASRSLQGLVQRRLAGYTAPGAQEVLPAVTGTATGAQVRRHLLRGLADELDRLLAEGVARDVDDVDAAMLLGAGFPPHQGGLSGLLDASGASLLARGCPFRSTPEAAR